MIRDVTDDAAVQLQLLAQNFNVPLSSVVYKIDPKLRNPSQLVWFISLDTSYDARYIPKQIKGLNFAVEKDGAIFLVDVVIDYDPRLLVERHLYDPTTTEIGKPVWPRGFVFRHQTDQFIET